MSIPTNGLLSVANNCDNAGISSNTTSIAPDIYSIPMNNIPKPTKNSPAIFSFLVLQKNNRQAPTISAAGAIVDGFKSSKYHTPPGRSPKDTIHAVTVVPMFAP